MTGPTRPTSEQLRLVSSKTGEHILDTYLEASEKGNRTLPDLLDDLFNSAGSFYRGSGFYNWKGDYTNGTPYITGDTFKSAATGSIYVALRNFTASNNLSQEITDAKISLVFDGASILAAQTSATNAANSATAAATSATSAASSASTATTQATNASTSAAAASGSATAASTSATAAAGSATAAANSASAAASSASAASSSQSAASTSATNAQTSATAAAASQSTASTAAAASQTSATNSAGSASTAAGHASTAATQATNAANSATTAATQASTATTQATNAAASASTAATQATNASTSASNAATSATNAANSATAASNSATTASTQAATATTQATNAASSASSAATQATNAATSATNAAASATTATTEATNAAASATSAASSLASTLAAFDSFDDRYLGAKTADPTVDNDGNALAAGAIYFNTISGQMKVYTGSVWAAAYVNGADYVAKAGDTMSGALAINANLTVDTDTFFVDATNNRVGIGTSSPVTKLDVSSAGTLTARVRNTASTATAGFDATNTTGSALFGVDAVGAFTYTGTAIPIRFSTNAAERMRIDASGNVGIGTSSPTTRVHALSTTGDILYVDGSGTTTGAADTGAGIRFLGHSGATQIDLGRIGAYKTNSTVGNTAGYMAFFAKPNASGLTEAMRIDSSGNVGIGTSAPSAKLNVALFGASSVPVASNAVMRIESGPTGPGETILQIAAGVSAASIYFGVAALAGSTRLVSTGATDGFVIQENSGGPVVINVGGERVRVTASGNVGIGTSAPTAPLHVFTSGVGTAVLIESTDDTNVSGPSLVLRRSSPSPAADDYVGQIFFQGMDTAGAATNYARILARIEDPTNTSEDGALYFHTTKLGASTTAAIMNSAGDFTATGNVTAYSDARLKTNVRTIPDALAMVQKMRGVFFDKKGEPSVGVIAQEMEEVLPEVVHDGEYKSVAYGNIVGVLIEAMKEQQRQIDELTRRLADK